MKEAKWKRAILHGAETPRKEIFVCSRCYSVVDEPLPECPYCKARIQGAQNCGAKMDDYIIMGVDLAKMEE